MKKISLSVLCTAALFALTACAPATNTTPTETAPEPATAEAAPALTAEPAGALHPIPYNFTSDGSSIFESVITYDGNPSTPNEATIYRADFAAGQTTQFYHTGDLPTIFSFVADDTLYYIADSKILALPLAGGDARELAFDFESWCPVLYTDRYLYATSTDTAPVARAAGMRLDLQTGTTESWPIPAETVDVCGVLGEQVVISRIVSDSPVPFPNDPEMSDAFLQNSMREYDLMDPATGEITQKLLDYNWYGVAANDTTTGYAYLGVAGGEVYFWDETAQDGHVETSVLRVSADGTQTDVGIRTDSTIEGVCQGDDLCWLAVPDDTHMSYIIYDLQGNEIGRSAAPAGVHSWIPQYLLDDGRLAVIIGYDKATYNRCRFAVMDADAFLSGSTEYTELPLVE